MAAPMQQLFRSQSWQISLHLRRNLPRSLCTEKATDFDLSREVKGFVKSQAKLDQFAKQVQDEMANKKSRKSKSFSELLKESSLVRVGDPSDAVLKATIVQRVEDDLYIDFGGKFNCVCKVPARRKTGTGKKDNDKYKPGSKVLIQLKDMEMTARFMGYDTDMTLLEADGRLIGPCNE